MRRRNIEYPISRHRVYPWDGTVTFETKRDDERVRQSKPSVIEWLQTVPGIVTAVAGLLAAAGAFYYGGSQLTRGGIPQPAVTVTVPAAGATVTVTAGSSPDAASAPAVGGTALPTGDVYLSTLTPVPNIDIWGAPTEAPQQIGTVTYPDSIRFSCGIAGSPSTLVYDVAGYRALRLTLGVPNNAADAAGNSAAVQFLRAGASTQLIPQVTVALDQAQPVTVPLSGTAQLAINCTTTSSAAFDIVLGNATLIH
jgi:hypothetical protein